MQDKPEKISEEILVSNKYRTIIGKDFKLKDGKISNFLIYTHSGIKIGTMVLPITKDNHIIYCKEFRYGIEDFIYNFPIGALENNLTEIENVKKELKEESGYLSDEIDYLGETIVANYDETIIKYYIAKNCILGKQELEIGEYIEVFKTSIEDFEKMIADGKIKCPLTLSCFTLARIKGLIYNYIELGKKKL